MTKIIKVENCFECKLTSYERKLIKCPIESQNDKVELFSEVSIHKDCPLEDYRGRSGLPSSVFENG